MDIHRYHELSQKFTASMVVRTVAAERCSVLGKGTVLILRHSQVDIGVHTCTYVYIRVHSCT